MSRLSESLTVPPGITLPAELESAWQWMEAQGFGGTDPAGHYLLTPYDGDAEYVAVFGQGEPGGWLTPGAPGADQLVELGTVSGGGSILALWRTDDGEQKFVVLSDLGAADSCVIADSAVDLLRFVAVGYDDFLPWVLGEEPEDEEAVEALAPFRAWVESTFDVTVPPLWQAPEDSGFVAWLEARLAESSTQPAEGDDTGDAEDAEDAEEVAESDLDDAALGGELGTLLSFLHTSDGEQRLAEFVDVPDASRPHLRGVGLLVRRDREKGVLEGVYVSLLDKPSVPEESPYPRPDALLPGLDVGSATADDVVQLLGTPWLHDSDMVIYRLASGLKLRFTWEDDTMDAIDLSTP